MIGRHLAAQVLLQCKIRTHVVEPSHLEPRSFDSLPDAASATAWSTSENSLPCWERWARVQRATRKTDSVTSRMRQTCCSNVGVTRKTPANSCRKIELGRACSKGGPCHSTADSAGLAVREAHGQAVRSLRMKELLKSNRPVHKQEMAKSRASLLDAVDSHGHQKVSLQLPQDKHCTTECNCAAARDKSESSPTAVGGVT